MMTGQREAPPLSGGPPVLIMMKGHPGSGKSTLARALARALRCPLVDKDDARDCFQAHSAAAAAATGGGGDGAAAADGGGGGATGVDWNMLSYEVMFQVAGTQLGLGLNVVADCPLARARLFEDGVAVARRVSRRL
uniref:Uncharacterized protein n=1 Tax=Chlamydomonas euryale TaxID=1486919 RepID=A0A7R9Z3W5_9CHLO|mmetsp:Transcript_42747/g.128306  ORF Transcript_42747/g.128306 Transcript_42747/m.128306 type:complete len:136 (+) Transcript_42747:281-688(+)